MLEVHMRVLRGWMAILSFPLLVNFGDEVVLFLCIPMRYREVPAVLNICFLLVAVLILAVIFWVCYDVVLIIRGTKDLLGRLRTFRA